MLCSYMMQFNVMERFDVCRAAHCSWHNAHCIMHIAYCVLYFANCQACWQHATCLSVAPFLPSALAIPTLVLKYAVLLSSCPELDNPWGGVVCIFISLLWWIQDHFPPVGICTNNCIEKAKFDVIAQHRVVSWCTFCCVFKSFKLH